MSHWFYYVSSTYKLNDESIPYHKDSRDADNFLVHFFSNPRRYASIWNHHLFHNDKRIFPDDLVILDSKSPRGCRDVVMAWMNDSQQVQAILGLEIQTTTDYGIPIRILGYDCDQYQISKDILKNDISRIYENDGEFLYKVKKTDRFPPVLTMVLNCSDEPWDGMTDLSEMLIENEDLKQYYPKHPFLIWESSEEHHFDEEDLELGFELVRLIQQYGFEKLKEKNYCVSRDIAKMVYAITGKKKILKFIDESDKEKINMCEALDWLENQGVQKGVKQGIKQERLSISKRVEALLKEGLISEEVYKRILSN